ncbi:MAG: hypothetical protein AABY22_23615 [Nanoarchaeota archaeon]
MRITIDTDKKYVLCEAEKGSENYPTSDPAEILLIVAEKLVPKPFTDKATAL